MKKEGIFVSLVSLLIPTILAAPLAHADLLRAEPDGFDEVPTLSSPARANFNARLNKEETEIRYAVRYSGFTTDVTQAHIHLGKRAVNGGVMVFICTNLGNGPAGTPACPLREGTVSGTWTAASVVGGAAAQGVAPGEFDELVEAIRNNAGYVNIHSQQFPLGEIRDQVKALGFSRHSH